MRRGKKGETHNVTVPIKRGGDMETFYEQEARRYGIGLPRLFYLLLEDRYQALAGEGSNKWFPRVERHAVSEAGSIATRSEIKTQESLASELLGREDD